MNEEILNKVSNKTNVDKDLIIKLAQKLSNGNMKDENAIEEVINFIKNKSKYSSNNDGRNRMWKNFFN